jgi:hypothetical protein
MTTLSLGSGLVNKITNKVFSDQAMFGTNGSGGNQGTPVLTNFGMGGYGNAASGGYNGYNPTYEYANPSYFSLMKGVVPSAISDISGNQRSTDELVRFTGPQPQTATVNNSATGAIRQNHYIETTFDGTESYSAGVPNDFLVTVSGNTATWSALNLSFLPRYPLASGTPTWFWFRTNGREHNIFGTVGATGSGSDLELATYAYIDASKEYTLYNATMGIFVMTNSINY